MEGHLLDRMCFEGRVSTVRLSVRAEHYDDITADLDQALAKV